MELDFPREYGRYRLTGRLGSGGTAEVYRAEMRTDLGQVSEVALRCIAREVASEDPETRQVMREEAGIWMALRHPNVVSVIDVGVFEGDWFLVLELVEGASADDLLRKMGPMFPREALYIAHRIALALGAAHQLNVGRRKVEVVHRDIKPGNILLRTDGAVKLTDFGLARATDRLGRTAAGVVRGTLHFLAPEQVRKEPLDARTDLFALGCTLYTMLSCRPLIELPQDDLLRALSRGEIPSPPSWLPGTIRTLLATLLSPDPAGRPPTAAAAADLIQGVLADAPENYQAAVATRVQKFRRSTPPWE